MWRGGGAAPTPSQQGKAIGAAAAGGAGKSGCLTAPSIRPGKSPLNTWFIIPLSLIFDSFLILQGRCIGIRNRVTRVCCPACSIQPTVLPLWCFLAFPPTHSPYTYMSIRVTLIEKHLKLCPMFTIRTATAGPCLSPRGFRAFCHVITVAFTAQYS